MRSGWNIKCYFSLLAWGLVSSKLLHKNLAEIFVPFTMSDGFDHFAFVFGLFFSLYGQVKKLNAPEIGQILGKNDEAFLPFFLPAFFIFAILYYILYIISCLYLSFPQESLYILDCPKQPKNKRLKKEIGISSFPMFKVNFGLFI